ncbi:TPA: flagellar basal body stator protein MotB [Candidatus Sumerlaeota bacterium]|jgi:chemotaxis protein MotB|nr:flagellar basal body stator protein MotB [Candidatus Sumerlaeota bacterium]
MARKKEAEKPPNHERWLVSWADFMTLLFALFVVLFANSQTDTEKLIAVSKSVSEAMSQFGFYGETRSLHAPGPVTTLPPMPPPVPGPPNPMAPETNPAAGMISDPSWDPAQGKSDKGGEASAPVIQEPTTGIGAANSPEIKQISEELEALLAEEIKKGNIKIEQEKRGVVISLGEKGFFDSGSADLKPASKAALDAIGIKLKELMRARNITIRVEGHSDDRPLGMGSRYRDNLELSTARSNSVVRVLQKEHQFPPRNLVASGYGEYRPIASNANEDGRAKNRRVDIVLLNDQYAKAEPQ